MLVEFFLSVFITPFVVVDTVPEFLLKDDEDDDDDDVDIDVDTCSASPFTEPVMSSAAVHDSLPTFDELLSTFTGIRAYIYIYIYI